MKPVALEQPVLRPPEMEGSMRVMVHAVEEATRARVLALITAAGLEFSPGPASPQDMCTALYRDPDLFGVIITSSPVFAFMTCREWRDAGVINPIFVLIDDQEPDYILSRYFAMVLMAGADDAQKAEIDPREFRARIEAISRRERGADPAIEFCGCRFDATTGEVQSEFGSVFLTQSEHVVLAALIERNGGLVSKQTLMHRLYEGRDEAESKIVDVFVCTLRRKLGPSLGGRDVIETVWGQGYRLVPEGLPAMREKAHA